MALFPRDLCSFRWAGTMRSFDAGRTNFLLLNSSQHFTTPDISSRAAFPAAGAFWS